MPGISEQARVGARAAARDLIRLVRGLELEGIGLDDLDETEREALEAVNRGLAAVLGARGELSESVTAVVDRCRTTTAAVRAEILRALPRERRVEVMEALLRVEVDEADLEVEIVPAPTAAELTAERIRGARKRDRLISERRRAEMLRRRTERMGVGADDTVPELFERLPRAWQAAIWGTMAINNKGGGRPTGAGVAAYLTDPGALVALVENLRPGEREALALIVAAGGLAPARIVEERFGDSSEDGFDWQREPPTSVLGRLRARGLVVIGRAAVGPNPRSRPRVVLVPRDLRRPLARALADSAPPPAAAGVIAAEIVTEAMDGDPSELEGLDRVQPELAAWSSMLAAHMSDEVGPAPLLHYVGRVWASYEEAQPERVPRLRAPDIEIARLEAVAELDAAWVMHEKLLARRVVRLVARQPNLYGYISAALEDEPWPEEDKLLVFHACDVAVRAFDAVLGPSPSRQKADSAR